MIRLDVPGVGRARRGKGPRTKRGMRLRRQRVTAFVSQLDAAERRALRRGGRR